MANNVLCKTCGFTDTHHYDVDDIPQIDHDVKYDKAIMYSKIVCLVYDPDIEDGDKECTCQHRNEWCNGFCKFK
jgi:hypothetical protein